MTWPSVHAPGWSAAAELARSVDSPKTKLCSTLQPLAATLKPSCCVITHCAGLSAAPCTQATANAIAALNEVVAAAPSVEFMQKAMVVSWGADRDSRPLHRCCCLVGQWQC